MYFSVNVVYIDKDGNRINVRGKVGDNILYLAHRYEIPMEGLRFFILLAPSAWLQWLGPFVYITLSKVLHDYISCNDIFYSNLSDMFST